MCVLRGIVYQVKRKVRCSHSTPLPYFSLPQAPYHHLTNGRPHKENGKQDVLCEHPYYKRQVRSRSFQRLHTLVVLTLYSAISA